MTTNLYFDLTQTLRLAEHAAAAPAHHLSFTEHHDGRTCPGALEWVADWGTYLMSGGRPGLLVEPADPASANVVVYAEGWGPESNRRALADTDVGGDDFVEHLHLSEAAPGEPSLLDLLRTGVATGYRYFLLRITGDDFAYGLSRTVPSDR
ncbi:MAG TPA: hypothetical protein VF755_11130 [Catenuloplanes sp.]|jgi:hypothetical protein